VDSGVSKREQFSSAIAAAQDASAETAMQWGVDDCALWVANIHRDVLGYDPAAKVRGRYKTRRGSMRVTGRAGLLGQLKGIARRHRWRRIRPDLAQPGDAGLAWTPTTIPCWVTDIDEETGLSVRRRGTKDVLVLATVICRARGWFVGRNEGGFTALRAENVACAWSVLPDALLAQAGPRVSLDRACHEPVSIGLAVFGFFGVAASTTAAAVVGYVALAAASVALSVGVSMVSSLLQPSKGDSLTSGGSTGDYGSISDISPLKGAQVTERQAIPYKRVIVGTAYVGGALFFEQVTAPYLTMGVLINYGKISSVQAIYVGTNKLSFSAISPGIILPISTIDQPDYPSNLRVSVRYGATDQAADPLILARYPNVGAEFRQRGNATITYEFSYGGTDNSATTQAAFTALWGQVARPSTYAVVAGAVCYDPRDPTQNMSDESTWKFTNNATLVQTWYLTRSFGGKIPMSKIRWDKTIDSANYDDDLIGCKDGTMIRRNTIDGVIILNQQPYNVMQDLLTANRAMLLESGGSVWIESARPKTAIATIHDRIVAGGITYQAAKQKVDRVNRLQVRFVVPDQEYQVVDGPILNRTDLAATDGQTLQATLALNYTTDHRRAQRLQKAFLLSTRLNGTITCTVDVRLMAIAAVNAQEELVGQVVNFDSVLFAKANGAYMVTAVGFADDCTTLALALTRYDPSVEYWNPEIDEQEFVLANINTNG
jgi:hypothetical protein